MRGSDSVTVLPGVGEKKMKLYAKLGVSTLEDLLCLFPRAYEDWSHPIALSQAQPDTPCCVRGWVMADPQEYTPRRGMTLYRFAVTDGRDKVQVTLFNNRFAAAKVHYRDEILLYGVVKGEGQRFEMTSPQIGDPAKDRELRPIYPQTEGLTSRMIAVNVRQALQNTVLPPVMPVSWEEKFRFSNRMTAIRNIHFPTDTVALEKARERLAFEELAVLQCGLLRLKHRPHTPTDICILHDYTEEFTARLPFVLTDAQRRAIRDCVEDMKKATPMARLVQGDVGSGKTAVAAGVAYSLIRHGFQVAMMAPTEILAEQHAESMQKLLGDSVRVALLTGSVKVSVRRNLLDALVRGEIDLLVGTHALITAEVQFARLGLVITDEQHRFGVRQRALLAEKGANPHMLVMSATPIPRTLALMIYGDLDVSVLDELPPGRQPVATYAVNSEKRKRAYAYVRKFLDEGRQGFIVCPLVEEKEDASTHLQSAKEMFDSLSQGPFAGYRLGLLHGKMKPAEKEATMRAFSAGEIQLLISTTVIEVGVDVPNAVILVVENADRFGLAQLHQLRGRVGRGQYPSTCILISDATGDETRRRLQVMCATNDGFRIADEDLKLRGPGDFFGNRQSGLPPLRIGDLIGDTRLLTVAKACAANCLAQDPTLSLPENAPLKTAVDKLFATVGEQGLN